MTPNHRFESAALIPARCAYARAPQPERLDGAARRVTKCAASLGAAPRSSQTTEGLYEQASTC
jgi:hypothetical protein